MIKNLHFNEKIDNLNCFHSLIMINEDAVFLFYNIRS
jgi:hypothetical protein